MIVAGSYVRFSSVCVYALFDRFLFSPVCVYMLYLIGFSFSCMVLFM